MWEPPHHAWLGTRRLLRGCSHSRTGQTPGRGPSIGPRARRPFDQSWDLSRPVPVEGCQGDCSGGTGRSYPGHRNRCWSQITVWVPSPLQHRSPLPWLLSTKATWSPGLWASATMARTARRTLATVAGPSHPTQDPHWGVGSWVWIRGELITQFTHWYPMPERYWYQLVAAPQHGDRASSPC